MKKSGFAVFSILCALAMLGSCASVNSLTRDLIVFDESIPEEASARIFFFLGVEVTYFNGIPVPTGRPGIHHRVLNFQSEWRYVMLPAGEMEFQLSAEAVTSFVRNVYFTFTFGPGDYYVAFTSAGGDDLIPGMNIFSGLPRNLMSFPRASSGNFIAFVPVYRNR